MTESLSPQLTRNVLAYLHVEAAPPTVELLDQLLARYIQTVPWESVSRIARRAHTAETQACPRWSEEFWQSAIASGTGGTCFESNRAFFALLRSLGYQGYLTLNNMHETIGCHTAIIIQFGEQRRLVDVGYPIHRSLALRTGERTEYQTPLFRYTIEPVGPNEYVIENHPHPKPYMFNLLDTPIDDASYRLATTNDYGEHGLFLDQLIINKIVNGTAWRFYSGQPPAHLQEFQHGNRTEHPIRGDVAAALHAHFGIAADIVETALKALESRGANER